MSLSSVIEKCISLVTGKGSESEQTDESVQQDQNYEQNQQEQSWEQQEEDQQEEEQTEEPIMQSPDSRQDSDM